MGAKEREINMEDHAKMCCVVQCYYEDDDCPVVKGEIKPISPCEYCGENIVPEELNENKRRS